MLEPDDIKVLIAAPGVKDIATAYLDREFPNANSVEVAKGGPPPGSVQVAVLDAVHGSGCGGFRQYASGNMPRSMGR